MKNIYKALCFVVLATFLVACPKDDSPAGIAIRDRQEVYNENIVAIDSYLDNNYLTVDPITGEATIKAIDAGQTSLRLQTTYPLQSFTVKNDSRRTLYTDGRIVDNVDYKLYYIVLNEGTGNAPTSVDSTFTGYKGWNLSNVTFDQNNQGTWFSFPQMNSSDPVTISGFRQILSKIKTSPDGTGSTLNPDGTTNWNNYGNVIVFIPSGLAYFSRYDLTNIGEYQPIVFQIKLFARRTRDHDGDKVRSIYEDRNSDNDYFNDDTDGDYLPDFLDLDDDGDGFLTKNELTYDTSGNVILPFADCDGDGIPNYLDTSRCL
jgi:FKBP-type peptidyl-prolyl cis-trans isomerase FkpA